MLKSKSTVVSAVASSDRRTSTWRRILPLLTLLIVGCGRDPEIGGVISTKLFRIPAGSTMIATRDLTIRAQRIVIDGSLYTTPNVNLIFQSPSIEISGRVQDLSHQVGFWRQLRLSLSFARISVANRLWPRPQSRYAVFPYCGFPIINRVRPAVAASEIGAKLSGAD